MVLQSDGHEDNGIASKNCKIYTRGRPCQIHPVLPVAGVKHPNKSNEILHIYPLGTTKHKCCPVKNQSRKHVFLDAKSPYRDEDGEVVGLIGISPDITDRDDGDEV